MVTATMPDYPPENRPNMPQVRKKRRDGIRLSATDSGHGCPSCQCGALVASQLDSSAKQEVKLVILLQLEGVIYDEDSKVQSSRWEGVHSYLSRRTIQYSVC